MSSAAAKCGSRPRRTPQIGSSDIIANSYDTEQHDRGNDQRGRANIANVLPAGSRPNASAAFADGEQRQHRQCGDRGIGEECGEPSMPVKISSNGPMPKPADSEAA